MFKHSLHSAETTLERTTGPPRPTVADSTHRTADDLVVTFEPGLKDLTAAEAGVVSRWVERWLPHRPDGLVVMACTAPDARSTRVERLRILRSVLARSGVARERIRYTGDLIEDTCQQSAPATDVAAGTATLRVVSARRAEREVRSIRSLFGASRTRKGPTCTSVS